MKLKEIEKETNSLLPTANLTGFDFFFCHSSIESVKFYYFSKNIQSKQGSK